MSSDDFIGLQSSGNVINGTSGNDSLVGTAGVDTIYGLDGDDQLQGLGGADSLFGGNGNDEFLVNGNEAPIGELIDGGVGINKISTWNADLTNVQLQNVSMLGAHLDHVTLTSAQFSGLGTLTAYDGPVTIRLADPASSVALYFISTNGIFNLIGSSGVDHLGGNAEAQTIDGGAGNDVIWGEGGADVLTGGAGSDRFNMNFLTDSQVGSGVARITDFEIGIDQLLLPSLFFTGLSSNAVMGQLQVSYDAGTNLTTIYDPFGSGFSIALNGDKRAIANASLLTDNLLPSVAVTDGTSGDDVIQTDVSAGTVVQAGDGNDTIIDSYTNYHRLYGGAGDDVFQFNNSTVSPFIGVTSLIDGGSGNNTIEVSSYGFASVLSRAIITNIQTLKVVGLNGVYISASQLAGIHNLVATGGQAVIISDQDGGTIDLRQHNVTGTLNLSGMLATRKFVAIGDGASQFLAGGAAGDTLDGGAGNDTLNGEGGADLLTGGTGNDVFIGALSNSAQCDVITDFVKGQDKIDLSDLDFTGITTGTPSAGQLKLSYDATRGQTIVADLFGSGFMIALNGNHLDLTKDDFFGLNNIITGTNGPDNLVGTTGADKISGLDGDDHIQGLGGRDTLLGGNGDDEFLVGGSEIVAGEVFDGGAGNNKISTWGGDLSLASLVNVQTLSVHLNTIKFSGDQLGRLTALVANDGPVTINAAVAGGYYSFAGKSLSGQFKFVGTSGNDQVAGSSTGMLIDTGDGNDTISTADGADTLLGGNGDDLFYLNFVNYDSSALHASRTIDGGTGVNTVQAKGDISADKITNVQNLIIDGGSVALTAQQFASFNSLSIVNGYPTGADFQYANILASGGGTYDLRRYGNIAHIDLIAGNYQTTLIGNDGIQDLYGGTANDTIYAYGGDDWIADYGGNDTIFAGDGSDTINIISQGTSTSGAFYGEAGDDTFFMQAALEAGTIIDGGAGHNVMWAGTDISGLKISNIQEIESTAFKLTAQQLQQFSDTNVILGYSTNPILIWAASAGSYDIRSVTHTGAVDRLWGSDQNDTLIGDADAQTIYGGEGQDTLYGMGGDDTIYGYTNDYRPETYNGYASDVMHGGDGNDRIYGSRGDDLIYGDDGNDFLCGFNAVWGDTGGNDTIYGGAGDDYIGLGGSGRNYASGDQGNDTIGCGDGINFVYGGDGNDKVSVGTLAAGSIIDGGAGQNTLAASGDISGLSYSNFQTLEFAGGVFLPVTATAAQFAAFTSLSGNGVLQAATTGTYDLTGRTVAGTAISLIGSVGNDMLIGDSASQGLQGGAGNDVLYGMGGDDGMSGGAGSDTLIGGGGYDTYGLERGSGNDIIIENAATLADSGIIRTAWVEGSPTQTIKHDQLWFSQQGNDLLVQIIGTNDALTVKDWYAGASHHLEYVMVTEQGLGPQVNAYYLADSRVQNLVNAMAGMAVPTTTTLTTAQHAQLDSVLAANWSTTQG